MCKLRVFFIVCLVAWAFVDSFATKKGRMRIEIGDLKFESDFRRPFLIGLMEAMLSCRQKKSPL